MTLLLSFVGPSGAGKSTTYQFVENYLRTQGFSVLRRDVARPLRAMQCSLYTHLDLSSPGDPDIPETFKQDGALLGMLAAHFAQPLVDLFAHQVQRDLGSTPKQAIINTDCRNNAYSTLKDLGFIFVRLEVTPEILSVRRAARGDLTPFDHTKAVEAYDQIIPAHTLRNEGTLADLRMGVESVLETLLRTHRN